MKTLELLSKQTDKILLQAALYLTDISYMQGLQELYKKQVPQKMKTLREHALVESTVSSNRIEGVEVDKSRIGTLIFGRPILKDRNEEEVQGYKEALNLIHNQTTDLIMSEKTILRFHHLCRGNIWDAGKYKEKEVDIIQKYADGRQRVRFKTAYMEFKDRIGTAKIPRGTKTGIVESVIKQQKIPFTISDIQKQCPGVSIDMIRHILKQLKTDGKVKCLGRGKLAQWKNLPVTR